MKRTNEELKKIYTALKEAGYNSDEIKVLKFRARHKIKIYVEWGKKYQAVKRPFEEEKAKIIADAKYIPEV